MVQQILTPGVEHARESRSRRRDASGPRRPRAAWPRSRGRAGRRSTCFVLQREPREVVRQREDHMVIADRQELFLPRGDPLVARVRQALRAVPIPTRVVRDGAMVALGATIEMAAQGGGAATRESAEHSPVLPRQPGPVCLDEAIAVLSDDVGHLEGWPGHRFCSRRDRRARVRVRTPASRPTGSRPRADGDARGGDTGRCVRVSRGRAVAGSCASPHRPQGDASRTNGAARGRTHASGSPRARAAE